MDKRFEIASCSKMEEREKLSENFYQKILDPEEIPFLVTDEANLADIFLGEENELIKKVQKEYGVKITADHFRIPFWKLLDLLNEGQKKM